MYKSEAQKVFDFDQNNISIFSSYQIENVMDKLKLLNFERLLLKEMRMKQINKYYFYKSFNPGEQFFLFTSTCSWLINKTGKIFDQPQEFDDPNEIISRILKVLQNMDISTNFQSNKLIHGAGPISMYVIDSLTAQALKIMKFNLKKIELKTEDETHTDFMENDSEIILEKVEEIQNANLSDESDDEKNSFFEVNINDLNFKKINEFKNYKIDLQSEKWRLELERSLPQLKVIIKSDQRDWRTHLEQFKALKLNINQVSTETQPQLKKMQTDINFVMDKIQIREKHLNDDLKDMICTYKHLSTECIKLNTAIKDCEKLKINGEQELQKVTNDLENIKVQMDQRGNSMTDGSNLINIKKSIFRINDEISEMDIKIAVLEHTISAEIIRQSNNHSDYESILLNY